MAAHPSKKVSSKGRLGYLAAVRASKDPTVSTVLFEDSAAMLGLVVAFFGVLLTLSLDFDDRVSAGRVEATISELETSIKTAYPEVTRVFIEVQSWRAHQHSQTEAGTETASGAAQLPSEE